MILSDIKNKNENIFKCNYYGLNDLLSYDRLRGFYYY
jgi:hypothetical protein